MKIFGRIDSNKSGGRPAPAPHLNDVLTLADVAQLRDNLNALLADPRLQAEQEAFA